MERDCGGGGKYGVTPIHIADETDENDYIILRRLMFDGPFGDDSRISKFGITFNKFCTNGDTYDEDRDLYIQLQMQLLEIQHAFQRLKLTYRRCQKDAISSESAFEGCVEELKETESQIVTAKSELIAATKFRREMKECDLIALEIVKYPSTQESKGKLFKLSNEMALIEHKQNALARKRQQQEFKIIVSLRMISELRKDAKNWIQSEADGAKESPGSPKPEGRKDGEKRKHGDGHHHKHVQVCDMETECQHFPGVDCETCRLKSKKQHKKHKK